VRSVPCPPRTGRGHCRARSLFRTSWSWRRSPTSGSWSRNTCRRNTDRSFAGVNSPGCSSAPRRALIATRSGHLGRGFLCGHQRYPARNEGVSRTVWSTWLAPSWSGSQRRRWFMAPVGRLPPRWLGSEYCGRFNKSGNRAMLSAIRRASSRVSRQLPCRPDSSLHHPGKESAAFLTNEHVNFARLPRCSATHVRPRGLGVGAPIATGTK